MRYFLKCLFAVMFAANAGFALAAGRTISINFGSDHGKVSGTYGIVPASGWNNFSTNTQATAVDVSVSDGTSGVTAMWWSKNIYRWTGATDAALKGYLDDGACGDGATTDGPHIGIFNIPFEYYDVIIYYATDSDGYQFNPAAIKEWTEQSKCGDTSDSYDGTMRLSRNNTALRFGKSRNLTAEIGTNVSYHRRCFSFTNLDIKGGSNSNGARGGIAAIQIVECDPHTSEMYHNQLTDRSLTVPTNTYGAIAVEKPIKATQYASQTTLPMTDSTAKISGDLQYVEGLGTDTRTHTVAGWFRCDGLDGEKMLYAARSHLTSAYGGYKVVVDADGAINVGQCGNWAWQGTALKSADGVIKSDTWYHVAVAITSAMPDAHTSTVKVFVNGTAIDFPTTTMATNLDGGSKCIEFSIGGGVSAAGLYADFSAISDEELVQSIATNATYVAYKGEEYTATITSESARFSELAWEPALPDPFTGTEEFLVKVEGVDATQLEFDKDVSAEMMTVSGSADITFVQGDGVEVTGMTYDFTGLVAKATFTYNPDPTKVRAGYVRYDLDMGTYSYDAVLPSAGGRYEFKKIRIDGNGYDYHDRTVIVQDGDYVLLHDGSTLGCGLSLDVRGGEVLMGRTDGTTYVSYGRNGTRFNQSGGMVTVNATGTAQSGYSGFVLAHSATGGGCAEFNVTGGLFMVPDSSVCFNEKANTINVSKSGIVRAKGVFSVKDTSTGAVNVTDGGTFELGSLGMTADACAFTLGGGTLRGYEAGAAMASPITLSGSSTLSSAQNASLTVSGGATGTGTLTISEGTVKLGADSGLGSVPVTVADGATFDVNGFKPGNALTISGTGADGGGALVNNGAAISLKSNVTLADDAVIGGTGIITNLNDSAMNLGGHRLTIGGADSLVFSLGNVTVKGGGHVRVERGTLASSGALSLGDADLSVGEKGTLDLSSGTSVSCRNFSVDPKGTVVGDAAVLSVSDTLDASSSVSVPNLSLASGATLKGTELVVTSKLSLGETLNVTGVVLAANIRIATVSAEAFALSKTLVVNGLGGYKLKHVGTALYATKGDGMLADVALDAAEPWDNFEKLLVSGKVLGFSGSGIGETNVNIVAVAADGSSVTQRFAYAGSEAAFKYEFAGLRAGGEYQVSAFVTVGDSVCSVGKPMSVFTANNVGKWIDESADTFDTAKNSRTGQWLKHSGMAAIATSAGKSYISLVDAEVEFYPTNVTPTVVNGPIRDVSVKASYTVGFAVQVGGHAGVRLATNETGLCQFEVKLDDVWSAVSREVFAPASNTVYEIMVRLDETKDTAAYVLVARDGNVALASGECELTGDFKNFCISFAGTGAIDSLVGECHDTNLCRQYGFGEEYSDIDAAVEALGSEAVIEPVWRIAYRLHENSGAFTCLTNELLTVVWDKWYHVVTEPGADTGSVKYSYCAANNWIDYADEAGVEPMTGGWLVMNEGGLAWLAESATNTWLAGDVALGADLDLSSKNWTPIASFTGAFDGRGHTISGLNNTNVVDDAVLGEAGHYYVGTENDWGYTAYGLFGSATNAAFSNVTFADVAISNTADSAAALLGVHAGGDLAVVNVTNASGFVRGEGRAVAGLLTVGGDGAAIGNVVVTNNANFATIAGLLANDAVGGNVAQILAGTTWGTRFEGDVAATNNVGEGVFDVRVTDGAVTKDWNASGFSWLDLPVCNFAPAVIRTDANDDFWSYVEANDPQSVVIDPFLRTARMSAGYFATGDENIAGWWIDTISTMPEDGTVTLEGTGNTLDVWNTVAVDRNLTFDLNANCVYGVYDCDVFDVADGKALMLKNGVIYYAEGFSPTVGSVTLDGIKTAELVGDFYERTVPLSGLDVVEGRVTIEVPHSSEYFYYVVDSTPTLAEDWTLDVSYAPGNGGKLTLDVPAAGESGFYRVRITDIEPAD